MQSKIIFDGNSIDLNQGLSSEQVAFFREKYGANSLTPPPREHWLKQFLRKFEDPTIRILLVAVVLSLGITLTEKFFLKLHDVSFIDSLGIIFAVLLATLAGFLCELKSAREFELLNKTKENIFVKVLRNGQVTEVLINTIVVGDLVHLDLGDKVPADGVLLESHGLLFDQSLLTGESVPIEKKIFLCESDYKTATIEDQHAVFRGTMVSDGHGLFVVTQTGDRTELGKIAASLVQDAQNESETPLTQKMTVLAKQISVVGTLGAMLIFFIMSLTAIGHSPLLRQLGGQPLFLTGLTILATVLGFQLMKRTLIPFFASMDIELKPFGLRIAISLPLVAAIFGLLLAFFSLFGLISNPNQTVATPDQTVATPDQMVATSNQTVATPDQTVATPDQTVATSNQTVATPDQTVATSDQTVATSDQTVATPNQTVATSDQTVETPDQKVVTEIQPVEVSGSLNDGVALLRSLFVCFVIAVAIIVVAVPEGLPMMVAVSLAMNMMKMTRENCLIRKLVASETIGCATVICSDKTGTLTQNRMTPTWILLGIHEYTQDGLKFFKRNTQSLVGQDICDETKQLFQPIADYHLDHFQDMRESPDWGRLVDSIAVNTEAALNIEQETIRGIGNPTECALLQLLHHNGIDYRQYRDKLPRLWDLSHNSARKMSAVLVGDDREQVYYIKGAPERLLGLCSDIYVDGKREPIEQYRDRINDMLKKASDHALRVIALTEKRILGSEHSLEQSLTKETPLERDSNVTDESSAIPDLSGQTFLALIGISDPIRPEVPHAVQTCHHAGVDVKMITGDAVPTAIAIAKQAGILQQESDLVLTSEELAQYGNDELIEMIPRLKVLARATPFDKLRLIKALHGKNAVVGMTGDGTNDAPALRYADVGISMGQSGTEVAKEASDIVLVDDNFKSIVTGILWGRTLYQNIQRFLQFQLSVNVVALTCALIGPLVGVPLPLTVVQLLWINIIMDTFAAIAYSTDPPRSRTMQHKPIPRHASIITPSMGRMILLTGIYQVLILFAALYFGWCLSPENHYHFFTDVGNPANIPALTVFFTIFVMFQFWHKFNCRSLAHNESPFELIWKNQLFLTIILVITFVQILLVQASHFFGIGQMFRTVPLTLEQWLGITLLTATILPFAWLTRMFASKCWKI
ncbi:MAG: HAD-IC family P-type ATPase [Thermoguttaceae bacterium]